LRADFATFAAMQVYRSLEALPEFRRPVLTLGTFDGVHMGHRRILQRLRELADAQGGETVLLTFFPHPRLVLNPEDNSLKLLSSLDEKVALLAASGIDHLVVLPFDETIARMEAETFVEEVLLKALGVKALVVGYDHRFGAGRKGDYALLCTMAATHGFSVEEIPAAWVDDVRVSSTKVRNALLAGEVREAERWLGRPYSFTGTVVHGRKLGRELGYPTANIEPIDPLKLIPAVGVYAVEVETPSGVYGGMANIGNNPTIPGKGFSIEAHLFGFEGDIYDIAVRLVFRSFLRNELKFNSLDALKEQLHIDKESALTQLMAV
jgi:riboflavin kinase/FMN adenylyltransferase